MRNRGFFYSLAHLSTYHNLYILMNDKSPFAQQLCQHHGNSGAAQCAH